MRAISLWQPWASLWCSLRKKHETRHWETKHRGWLAVHAAKKFVKDFPPGDEVREILDDEFGGHWAMDLPTGCIIGAVHVVDCIPTEEIVSEMSDREDYVCGNFSSGRFGWKADKGVLLPQPVPYRGLQSMFSVPDELMAPLKLAA